MDIYQVFLKLSYHAEPNPKHYLCYTFIGIFFWTSFLLSNYPKCWQGCQI